MDDLNGKKNYQLACGFMLLVFDMMQWKKLAKQHFFSWHSFTLNIKKAFCEQKNISLMHEKLNWKLFCVKLRAHDAWTVGRDWDGEKLLEKWRFSAFDFALVALFQLFIIEEMSILWFLWGEFVSDVNKTLTFK
jgi:hypothetical protein